MNEITVREEKEADIQAISHVTAEAFNAAEVSELTEPFIILALRDAGALSLSLVAELENRVVGHIAFSPVKVSDGTRGWFGLGPVSVLPEFQRRGIGKMLIGEGLRRLQGMNAAGCCLVGDPDYYRKLGFVNMPGFVHEGISQQFFMGITFNGVLPRGYVEFHSGFQACR